MRIQSSILLAAVSLVATQAMAQVSVNTVSFQEGVNGYLGTFDMLVSENPAEDGRLGSSTPAYFLDGQAGGSPDTQGLIRFDNILGAGSGQIPFGATILRAGLTVTTNGDDPSTDPPGNTNSQTSGPYVVAGMLSPFNAESRRTDFGSRGPIWRQFASREFSATRPQAGFGDAIDRTINANDVVTANVTNIVQRWANGSLDNNGLTIQAGYTGTSDGWMICTSSHPDTTRRPKLTVEYTTDPVSVATFQNGVAGYTGTQMAWLRQDNNVNHPVDGALLNEQFLDGPAAGSPDDRALIRFDNIFASQGGFVPDSAEIIDAYVVISTGFTSANARSRDGWDIHQMLVDWDVDGNTATPTYYSEFGGGFGPTVGTDMTDIIDTEVGLAPDSQAYFDVTSSIKAFQDGSSNNYGFNIKSTALVQTGTSDDGWQIFFTGAAEVESRPQLIVRYKSLGADWVADADGNWSDPASWINSFSPNGIGVYARLGDVISAPRTVTIDVPVVIDTLTFDSPNAYTVAFSGGSLEFKGGTDAGIVVVQGSHAIDGDIAVRKTFDVKVAAGSSLAVSGALITEPGVAVTKTGEGLLALKGVYDSAGSEATTPVAALLVNAGTLVLTGSGIDQATAVAALVVADSATLDIGLATVIVNYAGESPESGFIADVLAGRIVSNAITDDRAVGITQASNTTVTGPVDDSTLVIQLALRGDTNLSGSVDFTDLLALARNFNGVGGWSEGDTDYSGTVEFNDLLAVARNFGQSLLGVDDTLLAAGTDADFISQFQLALSVVPEPATLGLLAAVTVLGLRRR